MPRPSRLARARRAAALKGWQTRRARARERSQRARKGWRTRKARARIKKKIAKPHAAEWLVSFNYNQRAVDFIASGYDSADAAKSATWAHLGDLDHEWMHELAEQWRVRVVYLADSTPGSRKRVSMR